MWFFLSSSFFHSSFLLFFHLSVILPSLYSLIFHPFLLPSFPCAPLLPAYLTIFLLFLLFTLSPILSSFPSILLPLDSFLPFLSFLKMTFYHFYHFRGQDFPLTLAPLRWARGERHKGEGKCISEYVEEEEEMELEMKERKRSTKE